MADSKVALNDALADSAVETLALYKAHMVAGRYEDARQCLSAVRALTDDVSDLEERDETFGAGLEDIGNRLFADAPVVGPYNP